MVCDPTFAAEQATWGAAGRRSARAKRHLLEVAHRSALGGHPGTLWAAHDLREPLQPVAAGGRVGPASGSRVKGLRWRYPDDRFLKHPRASARRQHPKKDDR